MTIKIASVYADGHRNNSLFAQNDPTHTYAPTYKENIKNAMAYTALFLFIFIIYSGCTFIKKFKDKNKSL
jgi:hypothetical protein